VSHLECAFEVDTIAGPLISEIRSRQRLGPGLHVKCLILDRNDRETAAVDRDALAQLERITHLMIGPGNLDSPALARVSNLCDPTQPVNQSRKPPAGPHARSASAVQITRRRVGRAKRGPPKDATGQHSSFLGSTYDRES